MSVILEQESFLQSIALLGALLQKTCINSSRLLSTSTSFRGLCRARYVSIEQQHIKTIFMCIIVNREVQVNVAGSFIRTSNRHPQHSFSWLTHLCSRVSNVRNIYAKIFDWEYVLLKRFYFIREKL
ncbi:unnamed protein product [Ilex paraguariensis]|uniref:Uncharacterized protein n=1 Tax=Ilex paraguariensis TaxID=185542 RepID=A0ABC8RR86_9AQUA